MYGGGVGPYSKPRKGLGNGVGLPKRNKGRLNRRKSKPKRINLGRIGKGALKI